MLNNKVYLRELYSPKEDFKKKLMLLCSGVFFVIALYYFSKKEGEVIVYPMDFSTQRCPAVHGIERVSWAPRTFIYRNFLAEDEIDYLLNLTSTFERQGFPKWKVESNYQHYLKRAAEVFGVIPSLPDYPNLINIDYKLAMWSLHPIEFGENLVYTKITPNNHIPAYDEFISHPIDYEGGQRVVTIMIVLSEADGGNLHFPDGRMTIYPSAGDAILFYNLLPSGQKDITSKHSFFPVESGELKVLFKSFRQDLYPYNVYAQIIPH